MYKSTTDQGKAINLFNSILRLQEIAGLRPYFKIDKVKKILRLAKVVN
jgi:hypothetical protein